MGSDMFLGFNNRIKRVIFVLPLLLISNFALSDGTYWRINAWYNEDSKGVNNGGFDFSKCGDNAFPVNVQYGDSDAPRDDMVQDTDQNYIMFTYGTRWEKNKRSGIWKFSQGIEFKAPAQFKAPIISAVKKALAQGNCQAAADLMRGLGDGQSCKGKNDGEAYCFARENADGSKNACLVESDGSSFCKVKTGQGEETNPDGTPKLHIDCGAGMDCRKETDLDGYADLPDTSDNNKNNGDDGKVKEHRGDSGNNNDGSSGQTGGSGSDGPDKRGNSKDDIGKVGSGNATGGKSSNTKTEKDSDKEGAQDDGKTDKKGDSKVKDSDKDGDGKASDGDGKGSGGGNGSGAGNGKGDKTGDGDKGDGKEDENKESVDFFEAPSIDEAFAPLKKALKDKFSPKVEIGGGDCPKPQFSLMGKTFVVSAHCEILAQLREQFATLMMFLYTFAAIRIVLSA
jgi:protein T05C12.10, partially confirmed by transcript evidence|nr:MAG TPA: hypothetical protein [Inoviridae sp.]